jgi:hypothetical protein
LRVASHVAAHESGNLAATSRAGEFQALGKDSRQFAAIVGRSSGLTATHNVRVAVGKDHNIASAQGDWRAILQASIGLAFRDQVINDDVACPGADVRSEN